MSYGNHPSFTSTANGNNPVGRRQWDPNAVCLQHGNHTNSACRVQNHPHAPCVLHAAGHTNRECRSQGFPRSTPHLIPTAPRHYNDVFVRPSPPQLRGRFQAPPRPLPTNFNHAWSFAAARFGQEAASHRAANLRRVERLRCDRAVSEEGEEEDEEAGDGAGDIVPAVNGVHERARGEGRYRFKETFKFRASKQEPASNNVGESPAPQRKKVVPPHVAHAERLRVAALKEKEREGGEEKGR
ncbi:hypothetical protein CERZMDRAFT_97607 [Cercospora zeae-maydis SCOH1-5]|uniref:Uncharacterized protein n=1 Tax=Cercospora zeae-maydis SCOH1-5 TaxID=717836 RepID=A0A6A6FG11_9PEZI|nr:hypothetical protein CERZMDRAFT_97607 [Cercospora zeae-maydis SCOH1-5]